MVCHVGAFHILLGDLPYPLPCGLPLAAAMRLSRVHVPEFEWLFAMVFTVPTCKVVELIEKNSIVVLGYF
jgi:hypothetical protein